VINHHHHHLLIRRSSNTKTTRKSKESIHKSTISNAYLVRRTPRLLTIRVEDVWAAAHWAKYTINQLSRHLKIYTNYGQNL